VPNISGSPFRFGSFWFVFDLCGLIKYQEVVAIAEDWGIERLGNNECFRRAVNDSTPKSAEKINKDSCVPGDLCASLLANFRF